MKTVLSIFAVTLLASVAFAQVNFGKYDNSWVFGNLNSNINTVLNFQTNELKFLKSFPKILSMDFSNSSISNSDGQLQFFTNGVSIASATGKYLENGKFISPETSKTPWFNYGVPAPQQSLVLPWPQHPDQYYVFHTEFINSKIGTKDFYCSFKAYFSVVDMSENSGEGKVVAVNQEVVADTLTPTQLSACKHANGRDYWIFIHKLNTNLHYRLLLTPQGVTVDGKQECGDIFLLSTRTDFVFA